MTQVLLDGGFHDIPLQSAQAFRVIMEAMARPGRIQTVPGATPPRPMSAAAAAVVLTLCDPETPLYLAGDLDCPDVQTWITFHTGAPFASAKDCMFALGSWPDLVPFADYPVGTPEYPDRSATLIVETDTLTTQGAKLTGPGIATSATLSLPDAQSFRDNHRLYPLGLDFMFTCGDQLAALPRSTEVN